MNRLVKLIFQLFSVFSCVQLKIGFIYTYQHRCFSVYSCSVGTHVPDLCDFFTVYISKLSLKKESYPPNKDINTFVFADIQAVRRTSGTNMFNALQCFFNLKAISRYIFYVVRFNPGEQTEEDGGGHIKKQKHSSLADTLVHYKSLMMSKFHTVIVASQTKTLYKNLPEHIWEKRPEAAVDLNLHMKKENPISSSKCRGEGGVRLERFS